MAIPKFDELMPAVLAELAKANTGTIKWKELEEPIAKQIGLSEEEQATEYESGNGRIFLYRISWALTYLSIAKLIERPKRGYCKITDLGLTLVGNDDVIKSHVKEKVAEYDALKKAQKEQISSDEASSVLNSEITPDEALNQAALNIRDSVYEDILDTILSKSPYEFEKLVVKLLDKMGYGGVVKDAGQVTQLSNTGIGVRVKTLTRSN